MLFTFFMKLPQPRWFQTQLLVGRGEWNPIPPSYPGHSSHRPKKSASGCSVAVKDSSKCCSNLTQELKNGVLLVAAQSRAELFSAATADSAGSCSFPLELQHILLHPQQCPRIGDEQVTVVLCGTSLSNTHTYTHARTHTHACTHAHTCP